MKAHNAVAWPGRSRFGANVAQRLAVLRQAWARRKMFLETRNELRALSARDLADIGLAPGDIDDVARAAAYQS